MQINSINIYPPGIVDYASIILSKSENLVETLLNVADWGEKTAGK